MASNRKPLCLQIALAVMCTTACGAGGAGRTAADDGLVVLLPRDVQELDPRFTGDAYGLKVSRLLFASLVTIDPHTLEVREDLASDVQVVTAVHYRAILRPGLRFSDGSALDAHDVAATFRSVSDPRLGSRYAQTYARIERIEVEGPLAVSFHLGGPHATFLTDLELPIVRSEDAYRHMGKLGDSPPVGAGPYILDERRRGFMKLRANPHWTHGVPARPTVTLRVIRDDNTRALRLLAGAGDLVIDAVPPLLLPMFEESADFEVASAAGISTSYIGVNTTAGPLRDVRVRRALAMAIDRQTIIDAKLGSRARLARSWIPPGHWAESKSLAFIPHDPAGARALLAEAGYGDGVRLSLRCGSDRFRTSVARVLAAMWREVGIEVEVRPSEVATLIADLNRGRFELTTLQVPEVIEPHVLSWFFGGDRIPSADVEGANRWRLEDDALDAALERGRLSVVPAERKLAYEQVQAILFRQLPVIPLWHEDVVQVANHRAAAVVVPRNGRLGTLAGRFDP